MNELHNAIALRYKQSIVINYSTGKTPVVQVRDLLLDISQLGYTLDGEAVRAVRGLNEADFKLFHKMLVENLSVMVGANVKYRPLFKKFPQEIPDDMEYFAKRIVGFVTNICGLAPADVTPLSCGHIIDARLFNMDDFGACPICQCQVDETTDDDDRPALEDVTPLKIIGLATEDDVDQIFINLMSSKSSISEDNRDIVEKLVRQDPSLFTLVPSTIPMKENVALISGLAVEYEHKTGNDFSQAAANILVGNVKTATDVLRLAVQLSGGDVSLKEPTRFRLSNKQRRVIMWLLDSVNSPEEDMLRYKMRWIRLAEVLHVGKYAKKYPNAFTACDTLRNLPQSIETFNSKVESLVTSVNAGNGLAESALLGLLEKRPGEFARRLDWMLRSFKNTNDVLPTFINLLDKLPTPMLLTLSSHFTGRSMSSDMRYFIPKGKMAKIQVIGDERITIAQKWTKLIVENITNHLIERFSSQESLGNVYLNPELEGYLVPLAMRSASKSLVTIARGSHVPLEKNTVARMFLYWKQNEGTRVDVDLSAISYDGDWNYKNHLSYTNLSGIGGAHSGDIQSAPHGAAEFIDINIEKARANGVRYIVMNVISYTGQPFNTFECFAGVMGRDQVKSGKVFEPTTVKHKFDVVGDTRYNIPLILDLDTHQIIWADIAMTTGRFTYVEGKKTNIVTMCKAIDSMLDDKPNMFDLLWLHAKARGVTIDLERQEGKEYDTVFDVDMASNMDEILGKWL